MKKILFLLLCTVSIYGQTTTGQEQEFDYGIKNNSTQTITTPPYLTTTGMDGTQGKIPSAYIAKTADVADSLATKENVANKSDSYTTSSSTAYVSGKALVEGLGTKQNTLTNPVTGTFVAGRVPYSSSNSTLTDSSKLLWDNTNSSFEVNGNAPRFTLKNNLNNFSTYFTNNANGILFLKNHQDKTLAAFNNPVWSNDQPQMAIGNVSSIPIESQLYVYGGKNGANIDARGSATVDECNIDLEGADWETNPNSIGLSYFGSNATSLGTVLGYPKNKLGIIRFQDTNYAIINSDKSTGVSPIRFGINQIEIGNVNDKGFSYQSDFSSENISNPRWLTDKAYVDTKIPLSEKGATNGVATLGSDGKVPNSQIPALTTANITDSDGKRYQTDNQKLFNDATSSIQTQLSGKQNNLVSGTNIKTLEGQSLLGSGNIDLVKSDVGLSNVDNTSDANKPVSTAQQTALNLKENSFAKNTAFNKNFGTTAGTVAGGNDSRILNGQTAFGWGNHASAGYALTTGSNINQSSFRTALGLGSNAYTSTAYLPLTGGTLSGSVTASNGTLIGGTLTSGYIPKATGSNSLGNSLIFDNGTNVGIGTTTPTEKITLRDGNIQFASTANLNESYGKIMSRYGGSASFQVSGEIDFVRNESENGNGADIVLRNNDGTNGLLERMRIIGNGNVGIGNSAPSEKLEVTGTIKATSYTGSATLTGTPTAPTAAPGTTGNQIATLDYVLANSSSGTYTPTFTNTTNITSSTLNAAYYVRNGNLVTVTIAVQTTITATGAETVLTFSLPVSGATAVNGIGQGNLTSGGGAVNAYGIVDTTNSTTAQLRIGSTTVKGSGAGVANIIFTYSL